MKTLSLVTIDFTDKRDDIMFKMLCGERFYAPKDERIVSRLQLGEFPHLEVDMETLEGKMILTGVYEEPIRMTKHEFV